MAADKTAPARRGRPTKFDREAVVTAAMGTFWENGVDTTTLTDLEAAAGVVRTTIYNSFDGRDGLYRDAARLYVERTKAEVLGSMLDDTADVDDVDGFLERLGTSMANTEIPTGCFIVNDLTSPSLDQAAAIEYLDALRNGVAAALDRTVEAGLLPPQRSTELADVVIAGVIGANLLCRTVDREAGIAAITALRANLRQAMD